MNFTIIGGTGVDTANLKKHTLETPYGAVDYGILNEDPKIYFIPRHGFDHEYPPHKVNYLAQMKAAEIWESRAVFGTCAVGSCDETMKAGDIVLCHDFLDFTKSRPVTYYNGEDKKTLHIGMSHPYCPILRQEVLEVAEQTNDKLHEKGVYVCTEGPRFETAAEIAFYHQIGGQVVGMTNVPEVVLAKELGLCYVALAMVSNWCTGFKSDDMAFEADHLQNAAKRTLKLIYKTIDNLVAKDYDHEHVDEFI